MLPKFFLIILISLLLTGSIQAELIHVHVLGAPDAPFKLIKVDSKTTFRQLKLLLNVSDLVKLGTGSPFQDDKPIEYYQSAMIKDITDTILVVQVPPKASCNLL